MQTESKRNHVTSGRYLAEPMEASEIVAALNKMDVFENIFQHIRLPTLNELISKLIAPVSKRSFLVFRNNKYINVLTENIAFFYVRHEASIISCFDGQEYYVNHSLEQIRNVLADKQFFRLNRQYLVNFNAVKEVEHYFARKLLVNLVVPARDKLIVSKEKVSSFLQWLDNR